ncbi:MAG: hypothetical protein RIQ52_449 [Pseudomonadota bacterium]|jgi:chemotaxis signal transduction protein
MKVIAASSSELSRKPVTVKPLMRYMNGLMDDQKSLMEIQAAYDNLTLLGQLLCAGTDITSMRKDFKKLADDLLNQLAMQFLKKASLDLQFNARISIDILVRNLFERTADIGFLAMDDVIRNYCSMSDRGDLSGRSLLEARFREYVSKYSVYHNIILINNEGYIIAQLDENNQVTHSNDPLIQESIHTSEAYVEIFRTTDLLPGDPSPLLYAYRVMSEDNKTVLGVLCLCFRFHDECTRIFDNLLSTEDGRIIVIVDIDNKVIAGSDSYQIPVGARLPKLRHDECRVIRFAGREYLATNCLTSGYQGYMGPGWSGYALVPLEYAFEMSESREIDGLPRELLDRVFEASTLFSSELRDIPVRATTIQAELDRAVWNGNVWLSAQHDEKALNRSFAKVLLREIGLTGIRTRNAFSDSIGNLYKAVISAALYDCSSQSALAIDIMDRNLYERANDCRWWALTPAFDQALRSSESGISHETVKSICEILGSINRLYTVYTNLVLFDRNGRIVAVSSAVDTHLIGVQMHEDWVRRTLALNNSQSFAVSEFQPSPLYGDQATYIYTAAVRSLRSNARTSTTVGGIAIVFDSTPQFRSMLEDALPRDESGIPIPGAFALYTHQDGRVIATTNDQVKVGDFFPISTAFCELDPGEKHAQIHEFNGSYYAVGACMSKGYREYKAEGSGYRNDVLALVFSPLSNGTEKLANLELLQRLDEKQDAATYNRGDDTVDLASFYIGHQWYSVYLNGVIESVNAPDLIAVPSANSNQRFACMRHENDIIAVYDLSSLLAESRGAELGQAVVVKHHESQTKFAILVSRLGEILEIPLEKISPFVASGGDERSIVESIVDTGHDRKKSANDILILLSIDNIYRLVRGLPIDNIIKNIDEPNTNKDDENSVFE